MKLTAYERKKPCVKAKASETRLLSANRKGGYFSINVRLMEDLGMNGTERVLIAKDDESKNDWYISVGDIANGSKVRPMGSGKDKPISMRFQNKAAVEDILNSVKAEASASFIVATRATRMPDGSVWYRILTAIPKRKK